jgi:hypothetical protein
MKTFLIILLRVDSIKSLFNFSKFSLISVSASNTESDKTDTDVSFKSISTKKFVKKSIKERSNKRKALINESDSSEFLLKGSIFSIILKYSLF